MTLIEFIEARLAEDEAVAREAVVPKRPGTHWEWEAPDDDDHPESPRWLRTVEEFPTTSGVGDLPGLPLGSDCMASPSAAMPHIARHDPARVLRQCEAFRKVVAEHGIDEGYCARCLDSGGAWVEDGNIIAYDQPFPCPTISALASIWSDHPDYRQDWAL